MISWKQWSCLFISYQLYLLLGGFVFQDLESSAEIEELRTFRALQRRLTALVHMTRNDDDKLALQITIDSLEDHLGTSLLLSNLDTIYINNPNNSLDNLIKTTNLTFVDILEKEHLLKEDFIDEYSELGAMWSLWNSFFFSFTAITTIGFGHMYPSTDAGQIFCILYSLFGVPFNGIVFAGLGDLFASKFLYKIQNGRYQRISAIFLDACFYMIPGLVLLMVLPAVIIMYVENWSFLESFYFAFITLTTIGFGDYVAAKYPNHLATTWVWIYRVVILAWICFGLGYLLMVIAFIQRALRSEEVRKLDRKVKEAVKHRIVTTGTGLQKDLDRLGNVLNIISKLSAREDAQIRKKFSDMEDEGDLTNNEQTHLANGSITSSERFQRKGSTSVDILVQLAESVLHTEEEFSQEDDNKTLKKEYRKKVIEGAANPSFEPDQEISPSNLMRRISKPFHGMLGRSGKHELEPTEEIDENNSPESHHTLGEILDKVEVILHKSELNSGSKLSDILLENKEKKIKRSFSMSSPSDKITPRIMEEGECDIEDEGVSNTVNERMDVKGRRYTIGPLGRM